ncbi:MAG: general secretion pathway protein GspK, partial [Gammaproteobacteria bacterium]|nr:general secretion pathway protein GspK [Gammaproteobacteria bacterium]
VVPGVMLTASLEDLQGRFNLNNLVDEHGVPDAVKTAAFTQLLAGLGLEEKWTGYLIDWIDHDIAPSTPDGAEDTVYMGQSPPYRTPNRYITSITELLALPGFGRERFLKIAPYVSALPHNTKINLCTAAGLVLDAFLGHQDFASPNDETLTKNRQAAGGCFPTRNDFSRAFNDPKLWSGGPPSPAAGTTTGLGASGNRPAAGTQSVGVSGKVAETSSYFRLTSFITIGSTEFNLYSLLYQDGNTGFGVRPIQRSFTPD